MKMSLVMAIMLYCLDFTLLERYCGATLLVKLISTHNYFIQLLLVLQINIYIQVGIFNCQKNNKEYVKVLLCMMNDVNLKLKVINF